MSATPTPWAMLELPHATGSRFHIVHGNRKPVAVTETAGSREQNEANAALIVKAVNAYQPMLEALENCLPANVCLTNSSVRGNTVLPLDVTMGDLRKIAAAITLAKGETA